MVGTLYLKAHQNLGTIVWKWGTNNIFSPLYLDTFKYIEALFNFLSTDK